MNQEVQDLKNALRQSLHKIRDLKSSLEAVENASSEPIAIVGMSCRGPGGLTSPESYWSLLERGADGIGPLPERWSRDLLRRLEAVTGGLTQQGGFIDEVAGFDAGFFGISPREAIEMDPQQRLILEVVWEALERAGLQPDRLSQSRTGVYLGSMGSDYGTRSLEATTVWTATGTTSSVLAGRVSYVLGLEGPAMTVDTACSSSLSALHLACTALRRGECDLALTGGVTVMSTLATLVALGPDNGMAPDGRCKSFSDSANGAGWSEGCGVLVLKRRSDAERDGDEILALIRGSAVNQDGRSQGLTAPNGPSQQRVIRAALSASGVSPDDIDVVEAHGTGTNLGDPIEAGALAAVFGPTRREDRPLWLGSSKSNLGHTQAAAGVLSVMKMVLALRHEVLPKTLHAEQPSRQIEWDGSGLSLLQEARAWPREASHVRRAGVSSFGISGTNAHVVLEEAPARPKTVSATEASLPLIPLLVSGRDEAALRAQAGRYGDWLSQHPDVDFQSVLATAALHRTQFAARAAVSARDAAEAVEALGALAAGRPHAAVSIGEARGEGKLAFLFTGQGAQQLGMGRALLETCTAFRATFEEACGYFDELLDLPLRGVMFAEEGSEAAARLNETAYAQPALFAVEVALFRQLEQWGIAPDILLGHSIGELSAAHVAGVWSLMDACRVVAARGRLMQAQPAGGAMVALEAGEAEVLPLLTEGVEIAGLNGLRSTVISGDEAAVLALAEQFKSKGRRTSRLQVSHAFHSRRMEPMLKAFGEVLSQVTFGTPRLSIVSNVTGRLAAKDELCSAEYWVRQVRQAVRFLDGVHVLEAEGVRTSLELGPDGILTGLAAGCLPEGSPMQVIATQRRGRDGREALLAALGALHVNGVAVDWSKALGASAKAPVASLPTYAFQRQRYWVEAEKPHQAESRNGVDARFWEAVQSGSMERVEQLLQLPDRGQREHLSALLPALNNWYEHTEAQATVGGWCYEDQWQKISPSASSGVTDGICWLVSGQWPDAAHLERLQEILRAQGAVVECLTMNEAIARLQADAGGADALLPRAVVYLAGELPEASSVANEKPWLRATSEAAALAQAISTRKDASATRLWLCTPHALRIRDDDAPAAPYLQALWGLGRTLNLELAGAFGGLADFGSADDVALRRLAATFLSAETTGEEIALRGQDLWTRKLHHAPSRTNSKSASKWDPQGTILITGGTGALGSFLSHWLADRGAKHLILTSRRGRQAPGAADLVAALVAKGCRAEVRACDVGDNAAVDALVRELTSSEAGGPALRHIFHLAGDVVDVPLNELTLEAIEKQQGGKLGGAWALHDSVQRWASELASFVLYGSAAGFLGNYGQSAYSAANAGLTGLVHLRRSRGLPATIVHWGAWADAGMAADPNAEAQLRRRGGSFMKPELCLLGLERALDEGRAELAIFDVDWARARELAGRSNPLLSELPEMQVARTSGADNANGHAQDLRTELQKLTVRERRSHVLSLVRNLVAIVLGINDPKTLASEVGFAELGLDSLMAVEVRNRLAKQTGLSVPATLAFDHPNLKAVSEWVLETLELADSARKPETAAVVRHAETSGALAIIGVGLRFPGGAEDLPSFWQVLSTGMDTLGPIPAERFDRATYYDPDPEHRGTSYVKEASLLKDVAGFDAAFFGISPREAMQIDPQHRLLLEVTWSALEDAGIVPKSLAESTTGLFIGIGPNEYQIRGTKLEDADAYVATGGGAAFSAGRLAYHLGVQGPVMAVDTACSSSLVALHLASEHLRSGRCDLAIVGGVQVASSPDAFVVLSQTRALASDGRSKTFSDAADGYGRGEGAAVLAVMRLEDAQAQGKRIVGVVRGTAVNHDGASSGLTVPNGTAQQKTLRAALADAHLDAADVDVVECHGTGTSLGDPIEVQALDAVYGRSRPDDLGPLKLGAVKTNVGHLEAAAGLVGVIKMLASFETEALPPTLHCRPLNPHLDWERLKVEVVDQLTAWPRDAARPRRAGVSAFGLSGTNAHVVLEEAPAHSDFVSAADASSPMIPLLVSGRDGAALRAQAGRYGNWLSQHPDVDFHSVIATAALHRTQFASRAAVSVRDASEAIEALHSLAEGRPHAAVSIGEAIGEQGKLAFLFTGQGAQQIGMGRALLETCAAFRATFEEACGYFDELLDLPLRSVMFADDGSEAASKLNDTAYAQPALFAVEVALFRQLEQWGIAPDILLGHSIGELSAAHVAGVWSLKDACRVVAARGRLMQAQPAGGAMVALEAGEAEVLPLLTQGVEIAGLNGPRSTVISGDEAAVLALAEAFKSKGRRTSRLQVSHAFHSQRMEPMLEPFGEVLSSVTFNAPRLPIVSNVTGRLATKDELCSAEYWMRQVRQAVRFLDGVHVLEAEGVRTSLELGPDGILTGLAAGCLVEGSPMQVIASQRRGRDGSEALLAALGALHVHGVHIDWTKALGSHALHPVASLPTYAFQRQRYWLEAEKPSADASTMGLSEASHPLLGAATPLAESDGFLLTGRLSLSEAGWLGDHAVFGTVLLPGTGLLELGFAAARAVGLTSVSQLTLLSPLVLPAEGGVRLQVQVDALEAGGGRALSIYSRAEDAPEGASWTLHAQGTLGEAAEASQDNSELEIWPPVGGEPIDLSGHYARLAARGYGYGPLFQGLVEAWRVGNAVYGRAVLADALGASADSYGLHPALLDSALHVLTLAHVKGLDDGAVLLPFEWSDVSLAARGARELRVRASVERSGEGEALAALQLTDGNGRAVMRLGGLRLREASDAQIREASRSETQHLYRLEWRPVALSEGETGALIVGGNGELARHLGLDHVDSIAAVVARLDEGGDLPATIVFDHLSEPAGGVLAATHATAERGLAELQAILAESRLNEADVTWLTRRAVAAGPDEGASGLTRAPLWGLVRSARAEHPDRHLQLVDVDAPLSDVSLLAKLTSTTSEPDLALRHGEVLAPRLARAGAGACERRPLDTKGTVLITGGAGELGSEVARHLVAKHGVRHLLLTSRRGMATPGATELVTELEALGAQTVEIVSCDVSNRDAVRAVLNGIAPERPLTGVFHLAATLDDGVVPALTAERLERVLQPKLDGAWHLHELTADTDLAAFVLFSSVAGLGSPGQANYAAANTFLDALAAERRHRGLAGQSLLWGLWEQRGVGMTAHLGHAELMRMRRQGVQALSLELGLLLLDAAQSLPEAALIPIHLDLATVRRQFADDVPALYRGLVRRELRRASTSSADTNALRVRLAALASDTERQQALVALAQEEIAAVLALPGPASVPADQPLKDLGLDSLMAAELRNRLSARVGTKLPTTLAFDYPSARAMTRLLLEKLELGKAPVRQEKRRTNAASMSEPIAIVGMSCRTPGGPATPESYWSLLESGGDGIGPLPGRWSRDLLKRLEAVTGWLTQEGGFVSAVEDFDASFFGISPREALEMDPQQRLALEAVWEALERAGLQPEGLKESRTGVYLGSMGSDYGMHRSLEDTTMWTTTGKLSSVLAGRISYVLGLEGPAMTVDTACSSSLSALHLACTSLRQGECDLALAGGVHVMCTPIALVSMGAGAVAPDGRSKSFADGADGAGWSEGCGVLVLKRQSDAERDGDEILALIRGSAVNQDGRSQGLTAPNGPSQQRVIRAALSASGVSPDDIDVVEAHGTGTSLGDPIEAGALAAVFGPTRREDRPLWLGSSKSNLGHTQAAAGVLGVMKMVLALRHEVLPKTLHAEHPSSQIEWEGSGLSLLQQARAWPRDASRVRRAGVSSFGISGTNAHFVIEEAPARSKIVGAAAADASSPMIPLLVSGRDEAALRAQADRYSEWLSQHPDADFRSVLATAALHRTQFGSRASVSVRDASEAVEALTALAEGRSHAPVSVAEARDRGRVVFVFPGQGSQWPSMGRALLAESPVFAQAIAACETELSKYTDWPLTSVLRGDENLEAGLLERVDVIQPALFAMNVGLAAVWRSLGLEPSAVVGHSQGEIAAAVVAGILSLEDGARVVTLRSQLLRRLTGHGAMAVTELAASVVEQRLKSAEWSGLSVAVVNTPGSTVVSGPTEAIERWVSDLGKEGVFCRQVNVDYASHSAEMDSILPELEGLLSGLAPQAGQVAMISTVTGTRCDGTSLDGSYWCRNLRQTVRLDLALAELIGSGHGVFVEASAHPVLAMPLSAASGEHGVVVGSLRRDGGGMSELLRNLGVLHVHGVAVDWSKALGGSAKAPVASLPTYAFQRQRYWLEAEKPSADASTMGLSEASHPLLGAATPLAESDGFLLTGRLSLSEAGWLGDHAVFGTVLLPGTGLLELGFAAARAVGLSSVSQLTLLSPLVLPAEGGVRLQVQVDALEAGAAGGGRGLSIYSRAEDAPEGASWTLHAQGTLGEAAEATSEAGEDNELEVWPPVGGEAIDLSGHYARLAAHGYGYGPLFQGLVEAWRVGDAVVGRAVLAEALGPSADAYGLHPALLDSALHVLTLAQVKGLEDGSILLPFEWSEVSLAATGARELRVRASVERSGEGEPLARLQLADGQGRVVAHVGGLRLKEASEAQIREAARSEAQHLYRLDWRAVMLSEAASDAAPLIIGGDGKLAAALGLDHVADVSALASQLDAGGAIPATIVFDHLSEIEGSVLAATHVTAARGLTELQGLLGEARLNETDVTWLTRGAVATGSYEGANGLTRAPLWGLVRSARAEHPDRSLRLVDLDAALTDASLLSKLTSTTSEPELALRHGAVLAPRLMRTSAGSGEPRRLDADGTVLITGGAGELGSEVARHLVAKHGVRHLLLTSRRGMATPGAAELVTGLQALGAQTVDVVCCDVSDRDAVTAVLNGIPADRPLTGVFHLAATLDDGIVPALTVERLERVLQPKLDGAWHLHELTADKDLAAFVLFSSAGGLGSPGQANYAAANVFLDALAAERRHRGLAAQSLLWGLWEQRGVGMTAHLGRAELMRMRRQGVQALSLELGLALLDAAQALPEAMLIPIHLDISAMQRQFGEDVPPLYRGLVRTGLRRASAAGSADTNALRVRLTALGSDAERLQALVELAQQEIAVVLALPGASSVPPDESLKDLGLDSLMAVALRNRLSGQIGAKLPTTLAFDHPSARAIAQLLLEKFSQGERASQKQGGKAKVKSLSKLEGLTSLAALLESADPEFLRQLDLERRLSGLMEMNALLEKGNSSCIVPIRPGFGDQVMIYIPGLGHGSTRENTPQVIKDLAGDYPIAGLNPYPLAEQGLLNGTVEDLALNYVPHVESWIGRRSVFFVGGSFGGVVAIALASELERRGHHVAGVALLDTQAPPDLSSVPTSMMQVVDGIGWAHLMRTYGLDEDDSERLAELTGAPSTDALREMISDNVKGQIGYALPDVAAPIYMLHAREHDPGLRSLEDHLVPDLGWSRFGLQMTSIIMVGGTHSSMYAHPDMPGHIDALFEKDDDRGESEAAE